jgi:hypothetical protein
MECWGASGSNGSVTAGTVEGGKGAYCFGLLSLEQRNIYIYVGGKPNDNSMTAGYNGGGEGTTAADANGTQTGFGAGGATDIRLSINSTGAWNDFGSLKSRIIVAGGGSGGGYTKVAYISLQHYSSGDGGGLNGLDGTAFAQHGTAYSATGGTQTEGGHSMGHETDKDGVVLSQSQYNRGGFGYGGKNTGYTRLGGRPGGGGYYGGGASNRGHGGGGGGSSFISGHTGCNAISSTSTSTNIVHTGQPNHYSGYVFTNTVMKAGNEVMPSPTGGTETGHTGNGYAKITWMPVL